MTPTQEVVAPNIHADSSLSQSHVAGEIQQPPVHFAELDRKIRDLKAVLKSNHDRSVVVDLVSAFKEKRDFGGLIAFLKEMLLNPASRYGTFTRLLLEQFKINGDMKACLEFWKVLVRRFPTNEFHASTLTDLFITMGDVNGAIEYWTVANLQRTSPTPAGLIGAIPFSELAQCHLEKGNLEMCLNCMGAARAEMRQGESGNNNLIRLTGYLARKGDIMGIKKFLSLEREWTLCTVRSSQFWQHVEVGRHQFVEILKGIVDWLEGTGRQTRFACRDLTYDLIREMKINGDVDEAVERSKGLFQSHPWHGFFCDQDIADLFKSKNDPVAELDFLQSVPASSIIATNVFFERLVHTMLCHNMVHQAIELCDEKLANPLVISEDAQPQRYQIYKEKSKQFDVYLGSWPSFEDYWEEMKVQNERNATKRLLECFDMKGDNHAASQLCKRISRPTDHAVQFTNAFLAIGDIDGGIEFWTNLAIPTGRVRAVGESLERLFTAKGDISLGIPFWEGKVIEGDFTTQDDKADGGEALANAYGQDFDRRIDFWKQRFRVARGRIRRSDALDELGQLKRKMIPFTQSNSGCRCLSQTLRMRASTGS